jgi:uncharacterized protein YbjT (DUF2867 family)
LRLLLTGVTGLAGSAVLRHALAHPAVTHITALTRRAPRDPHPRLAVVLREDFADYSGVDLSGIDACLWCLGIAQAKVSRQSYEAITLDYPVAAARALCAASPRATFGFLSGSGADPSERSRILFARVKGRAEHQLAGLGLARLHVFRPGFIRPAQPVSGRGAGERLFGVLAPLLARVSRSLVIEATDLAAAMVHVALHGAGKVVLENADLLALAARAHSEGGVGSMGARGSGST